MSFEQNRVRASTNKINCFAMTRSVVAIVHEELAANMTSAISKAFTTERMSAQSCVSGISSTVNGSSTSFSCIMWRQRAWIQHCQVNGGFALILQVSEEFESSTHSQSLRAPKQPAVANKSGFDAYKHFRHPSPNRQPNRLAHTAEHFHERVYGEFNRLFVDNIGHSRA